MASEELIALQSILKEANASWTAAHNALLELSLEERHARLGVTIPAGESSLAERESRALANLRVHLAALAAPQGLQPAGVDWRNYNGHNYISAVKDQGNCGSCVAFGTGATIDGQMRIDYGGPLGTPKGQQLQDVSEAQFFYCSKTPQDQHNCQTGWYPTSAFAYAHATGLTPESCFPYTAGNQACNLCKDWQKLLTKVGATTSLTSAAAMKEWLATKGPLDTCFTVYEDFFSYHSGVYRHSSGALAGGHCVCCIGYSNPLQAWLCKNSWGPTWGLGGYFWIGYGQCGIDSDMWGIDNFTAIYHT